MTLSTDQLYSLTDQVTSAILNGSRYTPDRINKHDGSDQVNSEIKGSRAQRTQGSRVIDIIRIGTESNRETSNKLVNQIVYWLDLEQDHVLQTLHTGGSPL